MFDKIKKLICEKKSIKEDTIFLETRLKEDLALDSFDAVELVIELEKIFDLKISDEVMQQFKIVKDIVSYVESNLS
ncbi:acyl carrier protein [Candidatus Phytoplasma ziziphi]|uniref:Acyl carrier protein n=1 Tax=Ziziphus jujuba witches'-broom phytoplasma TaxID=135727 RepID=A0A660HNC8_ZIZJU|nr:acyl carrier protein [Candidatus Phytoplasma ziziphi]